MRIETREDAVMLREMLASIWAEYYAANGDTDNAVSTNMCCRTANMIVEIDPQWRVVHGTVNGHAHAWCCRADETGLDLTGDQFGADVVIWGKLPPSYIVSADVDNVRPGCSE